jgi:hypothetical protein
MSKVDHAQDAVYQRVAQGDERIDTPLGDAIDGQIEPLAAGVVAQQEGSHPTQDHHGHDRDADQPHDHGRAGNLPSQAL